MMHARQPSTARIPKTGAIPVPSGQMRRLPLRTLLIGAAGLLAAGMLIAAIVSAGDQRDRPRLLAESALATLPDAQLEQRLVNDLAQRLAYAGYSDEAWRSFGESARHLWAVVAIEEEVFGHGVKRLLADQARGDRGPTLAEARDAYTVMDLADAADAVSRILAAIDAGSQVETTVAAYVALANQPELRARRVAFLRAHLAELANP